ncbi:Crp/Fnr family transcriptional regulator [Parabacteroides sp. 52]|uniref:Crp/Fnr family transcriptional regulator n=1 Tax=Parabacteroides sp. 52 TaxID=2302940 RepID=UPI0013D6DA4C|nr:Crp/Fnr family transcriptional regulator [Parabacteroides sp. 52]NDV55594.1 Crp/Fnr family transcriptional regulator [Parabacteroides sp. 52]
MEDFSQLIHHIHPLPEEDLARLLAFAQEMEIDQRTVILAEGEIDPSLYLIKKGVVRTYWGINDNKETTIGFATAGEAFYSPWGYHQESPSLISISASSPVSLLRFSKERLELLFLSSASLSVWGRKLFENLSFTTYQDLAYFSHPSSIERYKVLLRKAPEILQYVPLKDIAAYMGMTQQALKRIRDELVKRRRPSYRKKEEDDI